MEPDIGLGIESGKETGFLESATVLIIGNLIVKAIGAIFRIPLTNIIGEIGMSYYDFAFSLFSLVFVLSTSGIPVAVSKMMSESITLKRYGEAKRIFNIAMGVFAVVGAVLSVLMFFFARYYSNAVQSPGSYYSVLAISPSIFFATVMITYRGYFQGRQDMVPTAVSQIIEAAGKLFIGISLAYIVLNGVSTHYAINEEVPVEVLKSIERGSAFAILGVTAGSALGMVYMILTKKFSKKRRMPEASAGEALRPKKDLLKTIISIAIPVTISSSVLSITNMMDVVIVMNRLKAVGFTQEQADFMNGSYRGMALPLFNFPTALVASLAVSVIPAIAAAKTRKNIKDINQNVETALRIGMLIAIPAGLALSVMANPILTLIFPSPERAAGVSIATSLLMYSGIASIWVNIVTLTNSSLQALNFVKIPLWSMLAGSIVKLVTNYILVGIPEINIKGAPIGTNLCYLTIAIINIIALKKHCNIKINLNRTMLRPLVISAIAVAAAWASQGLIARVISARLATLASVFIAIAIYAALVLLMKALTREDVLMLPKGAKIAAFLSKHGWLR